MTLNRYLESLQRSCAYEASGDWDKDTLYTRNLAFEAILDRRGREQKYNVCIMFSGWKHIQLFCIRFIDHFNFNMLGVTDTNALSWNLSFVELVFLTFFASPAFLICLASLTNVYRPAVCFSSFSFLNKSLGIITMSLYAHVCLRIITYWHENATQ